MGYFIDNSSAFAWIIFSHLFSANTFSNFEIDQSWYEIVDSSTRAARSPVQTFQTDYPYTHSITTMSDPFSINGGSIVALVGKDCVGIACELRLVQQAMTIST